MTDPDMLKEIEFRIKKLQDAVNQDPDNKAAYEEELVYYQKELETLKYFSSLGIEDVLSFYNLSDTQKSLLSKEPQILGTGNYHDFFNKFVFIIAGSWEGSELLDRIAADKIRNKIEEKGIPSLVLSDFCWETRAGSKYSKCIYLTVGGPQSNLTSKRICALYHLQQNDPILANFDASKNIGYAWGASAGLTLKAGKLLVEKHLDKIIESYALKNGQEPKAKK